MRATQPEAGVATHAIVPDELPFLEVEGTDEVLRGVRALLSDLDAG